MSYQLYRNTTLGNTLQESLDELISYGQITPQLALKGKLNGENHKMAFLPDFCCIFHSWIKDLDIDAQLFFIIISVLLQFDKSINNALATKVKSRITFKASKLNTYRFCDNVWTLM